MRGKRSRRGPETGGEVAEQQDPQAEKDPEAPEEDPDVGTDQSVAVGEHPEVQVEGEATVPDLDALSKELEKSLSSESPPLPVAAAPEINATPEEILGVVMKTDSPSPENPLQPTGIKEAPAPNPTDGHAAMATEVLRASTDQVSNPDDAEEAAADSKVRFSDDVTISAKKKRKLFGR